MGVNEPLKGKRRYFAITSLGRNRWYWVVWPSLEELQTTEEPLFHIDEEYEKTKVEAVKRAMELAGGDAKWVSAKYAKVYHRNKVATRRRGDNHHLTKSSDTPATQEFLYRDVRDTVRGHWDTFPHRVVRKTKRYVYVEQRPYSPDDLTGSWLDREYPTFRLERRALEQDGYAFISVTAVLVDTEEPVFFNPPPHKGTRWYTRQPPRCLEVLNLSWPCKIPDVKRAYRRLVKRAHPNGGGSHDEFLALQEAYEQALQLCE